MNLDSFLSQGLNLVGAFSPKVALFLLLACFIGEAVGLSVPYLLETTWLLAGYQLASGVLPAPDLLLLLFAAQAGRQAGAFLLFSLSRSSSPLVLRILGRFRKRRNAIGQRALLGVNLLSPLSVAIGRFLWLRLPLTLILGARRKLKVLTLGVLISGLVWDVAYVGFGAALGVTGVKQPAHMLLYFSLGMAATYAACFAARRLVRRRKIQDTAIQGNG